MSLRRGGGQCCRKQETTEKGERTRCAVNEEKRSQYGDRGRGKGQRTHLDTNRDANLIGRNTRRDLLLLVELLMRRRARLKNERVDRADVGELRVELERVNDLGAEFAVRVAFDAEGEDAAEAVFDKVLQSLLVVRVRLESGVGDPAAGWGQGAVSLRGHERESEGKNDEPNRGVLLEELGDCESVLGVAFDAKGEGLDCVLKETDQSFRWERKREGRNAPPWMMRKAEFGLRGAPISRSPSMRTLAMNDWCLNASQATRP